MFQNNLIYIPSNQEKEFVCAFCLTNMVLDNCTFIDNIAYNGGDKLLWPSSKIINSFPWNYNIINKYIPA